MGREKNCIDNILIINIQGHRLAETELYQIRPTLKEGYVGSLHYLLFHRHLNSLSPGKFFMLFCRLLICSKSTFQKILRGIQSECQTEWIQIRPDILSGLIWVQSVCKCYEQMTLVGNQLITSGCNMDFFELRRL